MQRWMVLLFALVLAGAVGALVYGSRSYEVRDGSGPADAGADAVALEGGGPIEDAGDAGAGGGPSEPDPGNPTGGGTGRSDAGVVLLSGEVPPPLSAEAPKRVRFGVILVQYRGSQGAAPSSRSREAALELARQIATEAAQDFKAALAKGDKGSTEDLGWMPRGVLEPAPEFVLFNLPKGGVGGPVDTPRGYWIVRRID